ncbi:hypothetical protein PoB_001320700 [Plakobranchus ocellatus]|uniref:Uncharacterized protein n=1 Tax=Plakobranchus ocellatus TaxID=259542 RepID=A0AAV3YUU3_9GAST|nr:hypothetical protein PoB_001320700 [Plakobranchus ocellatus]
MARVGIDNEGNGRRNCVFGAGKMNRGAGGTVARESALRFAGTLLSRVRAPSPAPWPDRERESPRSPRCGLAITKTSSTFLYKTMDLFWSPYRYSYQ